LEIRATEPAFHPAASQVVVDCGPTIFGVLRATSERDEELLEDEEDQGHILCLHNVSHDPAECVIDRGIVGLGDARVMENLVEGETIFPHDEGGGRVSIGLDAYEVMWLKW
jgi:sucrose phosphorylase